VTLHESAWQAEALVVRAEEYLDAIRSHIPAAAAAEEESHVG